MGNSISELQNNIKYHVKIAKKYSIYLEPVLKSVQFFLEIAEQGEGIKKDDEEDEQNEKEYRNKIDLSFISTEVELLAEDKKVIDILLYAIASYRSLILAPKVDPFGDNYTCISWIRKEKLMPIFAVINEKDLERYRISVLRLSLRCLRIISIHVQVREKIYRKNAEKLLNAVIDRNPDDNFVKKEVRKIFQKLYGDSNAVKRVVISNLEQVNEIMQEYPENSFVQLAGVQRINELIHRDENGSLIPLDAPLSKNMAVQIRKYDVIATLGKVLQSFPPSEYELYTAICRFFSFISEDEKNCKIIGQNYGIEGSVNLLKYGRGIYSNNNDAQFHSDFEEQRKINPLSNLTKSEVAQQALWTLDKLSDNQSNLRVMKKVKLKFILKEIQLNRETEKVGTKLIVPRKLLRINWNDIPDLITEEVILSD